MGPKGKPPATVREAVMLVQQVFPGARLIAARPEGSDDPPEDSDQWARQVITMYEWK